MPKQAISLFVIFLFVLTSCVPAQTVSEAEQAARVDLDAEFAPLTGRVIGMDGKPISGATVASKTASATSAEDGTFTLVGNGAAQWVTVTAAGFISRTRAASAEQLTLFRLSVDDGKTLVLHFGGDTMFGRRFFDANEDGDTTDGLLPVKPTVEDHLKLLLPIQPLLENATITALSLESPISDLAYIAEGDERPKAFHSTKDYVFASDPSAVIALKQAGVDVVGIGNNHIYDTLESGIKSSLTVLMEAGLAPFGAGATEAEAWKPALIRAKGQIIGFIACTTVLNALDPGSVENPVSYVASDASKKGGAAACEETAMKNAIDTAKKQADLVVVMIHGGTEYDPAPSAKIQNYSALAHQFGADLVINHHPHVVGGLDWKNEGLTAWTMGNFVFDQSVWPTFETYMLAVYVREGKVVRAYLEPLMMQDFVAHGVTAGLGDGVVRAAAGRSDGGFVMENNALELDLNKQAIEQVSTMQVVGSEDAGEIVAIEAGQWLSGRTGTGNVVLGRDVLWAGGFETSGVVDGSGDVPLWDMGSKSMAAGIDFAYEGTSGIQLTRGSSNIEDAVTSPLHRIPMAAGTKMTITGMMRANAPASVSVQLSWYEEMKGSSSSQSTQVFEVTPAAGWVPFRLDVVAPEGTTAVGLFLRLHPPKRGIVKVDLDNVRMIEWANPGTPWNALYNFALVTGETELTFTQQALPGGEAGLTIP